MYIIAIILLLLIVVVPLIVNRIYSAILDKDYPELTNFPGDKGYVLKKIPLKGKLEFQHTDSSADYTGFIYMDTVTLNFKVVTKTYAGSHDNYETAYITFDKSGKILETDSYIPKQTDSTYQVDRETINGNGEVIRKEKSVKTEAVNHLQNCILLNGVLPPWPKWKNRSSPVYINHFSKRELNLSELNPIRFGGINGGAKTSVWYGFAYCDVQFLGKIVKVKIPFGYDSLLLNTNEYYAQLQYYTLPDAFIKSMPIRFIKLDNDVYVISAK